MTIERFQQLLAGIFVAELGMNRPRADRLATAFADFEEFLRVPKAELNGPKSVTGRPILRMSLDDIRALDNLRKSRLDPSLGIQGNYIVAVSRNFATRQVEMIRKMTLDTLLVNPLLVQVLNVNSPGDLIGLHVEMSATRSIVTSMGFYLESLVWASSGDIEKAPRGSNWDFQIKRGRNTHWLQVKSGPNDMDKDQIVHWSRLINGLSGKSHGHIGFAYGNKHSASVSMGLLRRYLPNWEMHILVGHEFWQFVSEDRQYHKKLCDLLRHAALSVLHHSSIMTELRRATKRITKEFERKYGHGHDAVDQFVADML